MSQVDNPCAILDQENSKQFLQGSDTDKYNFFMRATDLSRILDVSLSIRHDCKRYGHGWCDRLDSRDDHDGHEDHLS